MNEVIPPGYIDALNVCSGLAAKLLERVLTCKSCVDFRVCKKPKDHVCRDYAGSIHEWVLL